MHTTGVGTAVLSIYRMFHHVVHMLPLATSPQNRQVTKTCKKHNERKSYLCVRMSISKNMLNTILLRTLLSKPNKRFGSQT
jgi:hypothetical protein